MLTRRIALVLGTLVVLAPLQAYAASESGRDARHDVYSRRPSDRLNHDAAPRNRFADITAYSSGYGGGRVVAQVTVARLLPHLQGLYVDIDVPGDASYTIEEIDFGTDADYIALYRTTDGSRDGVACRGLERHVDVRHRKVRVTVPPRCLHRPRWVRTALSFYAYDSDANRIWSDDARVAGDRKVEPGQSLPPVFGPRLTRD